MNLKLVIKRSPSLELSDQKLQRCSTSLQSPITPKQTISSLVSPQRHVQSKRKSHLFGYLFKNLMVKCTAELLQKNPKDRSNQDIKMIDKVISNAQIFNEFSEVISNEIRIECCKILRYKKFMAGTILQQMNSRAEDLYILISGKVGQQMENEDKKINKKRMKDLAKETEIILEANEKQLDPTLFSFPNTDFVTHNICRSKYQVLEDSVCAVLNYKEFDQIIQNTLDKDILSEISYFSRISFFSKWKVKALKHIIQNSFTKTYKINQIIFEQESSPDSWYLIREGEFILNRHLQIEMNQKSLMDDMMLQKKCLKKFSTIQSISLLQKNEFFGIEDIVFARQRQYQVKCQSDIGKLTVISAKEILKLMNKNVIIQIDIQQISKEKMNFIDERIKQIEDLFFKSEIKKIETKSRAISISQQNNYVNSPKNNLEKIQQVEDMLQIQEQFSKFHSTDRFPQAPEDIEEQIEIQKYLKLKGIQSMNPIKQTQMQNLNQNKNQNLDQKNGFQIRKQKESELKKENIQLRNELLDFYRKMIDDEYDVRKNKVKKQINQHNSNLPTNKLYLLIQIFSSGFKNRKVDFFNQKVLIPLQQTQKKRNEKIIRERQDSLQQQSCNSQQSQTEKFSFNNQQMNNTFSSNFKCYTESFSEKTKLQTESSQFSPQYQPLESAYSLDSYRVNYPHRKLKSIDQQQSIFSRTLYCKTPIQTNKNNLNFNQKVVLPATLSASPNLKNLIIKTIKKGSQQQTEQNELFTNYQDRFKSLSQKIHTISKFGGDQSPRGLKDIQKIQQLQQTKPSFFNFVKQTDEDIDNTAQEIKQNVFLNRKIFKQVRINNQNQSRSASHIKANPSQNQFTNFHSPYDERYIQPAQTLSSTSFVQGHQFNSPLRISHSYNKTEIGSSSFYLNKNQ